MPARAKTTRRTAQEGGLMADGNEPQGAATDPAGTEPHGAGKAGEETVSKAEYDKLLAQSRKWEERSKANAAKAKELDELKAATQTDAEKLADAEKRAEAAEAKVKEYEAKAERAGIVVEVAEEKGVDAEWLSRMAGDTREEVEANAAWLAGKLSAQRIYPPVNDNGGAGSQAGMTPEEIRQIKDPMKRLQARAENVARSRAR